MHGKWASLALWLTVVFFLATVAAGNCLLVCLFPEAIEITARGEFQSMNSEWGGVEMLFALLGLAAGWLGPILIHRFWEAPLATTIAFVASLCVAGDAVGLTVASVLHGPLPAGTLAINAGFLIGAAAGLVAWRMKVS